MIAFDWKQNMYFPKGSRYVKIELHVDTKLLKVD